MHPFEHRGSRRRFKAVYACGLAVLALSASIAQGCGGQARSAVDSSTQGLTVTTPQGTITTSVIPAGQSLRGDGDADNPADIDGNGDSDAARLGGADSDADNPTAQSYRLPDGDDAPVFGFGRPAGTTEKPAIEQVVRSFYAAARAGDGTKACSLLRSAQVKSAVQDYGHGSAGPAYLSQARSCAAVLAGEFAHYAEQLREQPTLLAVRVHDGAAGVVISSKTMPASVIYLEGSGASWKVEDLFSQPLP